jgi:DUF1680 family protein
VGHLVQAGVARARTHGDDLLVQVAVRAADQVCEAFGEDGIASVCGHPEIEMALVELSRLTGDPKYLRQAALFVERRGHGTLRDTGFGPEYFQDDLPVRDATVMRGHAVRALYLCAGAADVAVETDDPGLLEAVARQMLNTLARRTYLTGGMGAHHEGESFGLDFELPPDRAYAETCAGVASVMLSQRMLLATGEAVYADAVERTLFNLVAASPASDGRSFFYTNPLHQRVSGAAVDPDAASPRASSNMRAAWFEVSCCPTNVARTLASLAAYLATFDDNGIQLHQFADADLRATLPGGQKVALRVQTRYPVDGEVRVTVVETPPEAWTLSLRVPGWATTGAVLEVGGERAAVEPGYARLRRTFEAGDVVTLTLPMRPRWTWPDPRIDAVRGSVAVERGPIVLCMESPDLGASVNDVRVAASYPPEDRDGTTQVRAYATTPSARTWPYGDKGAETEPPQDPRSVSLIPYHEWANRGPSTMRVWLPLG